MDYRHHQDQWVVRTNLVTLCKTRQERQRTRVSVVFLSCVPLVVVDHTKHLVDGDHYNCYDFDDQDHNDGNDCGDDNIFANLPSLISRALFIESAPDRLRFIIISKFIITVIIIILIAILMA